MSAYRFIEALRGTTVRIPPKSVITGREVLRMVAADHGVPVDAIIGTRRFPRLVDARQDAVMRLTAMGWTLQKMAVLMNRDHTSIMSLQRRSRRDA